MSEINREETFDTEQAVEQIPEQAVDSVTEQIPEQTACSIPEQIPEAVQEPAAAGIPEQKHSGKNRKLIWIVIAIAASCLLLIAALVFALMHTIGAKNIRELQVVFHTSKTAVTWKDAALEENMREATGISTEEITYGDTENLKELHLDNADISDLSALSSAKNLECLYINGVSADDLKALTRMANLRVLLLCNMPVSDISPLAGLEKLEALSLEGTKVEDISALEKLGNLTELNLRRTPVADVSALEKLSNLKQIDLIGTAVSSESIAKLQEALPTALILHD